MTVKEIADAIAVLKMDGINPFRARAMALKGNAESYKQQAEQSLRLTADPKINAEINALHNSIQDKQARINQLQPLVTLEDRIEKCKKLLDEISSGSFLRDRFAETDATKRLSDGEFYRYWRSVLDQLFDERDKVPAAKADQKKLLNEIHMLEARIGDLNQSKLNPKNMIWTS